MFCQRKAAVRRSNPLHRLAVDQVKGGAQRFVPRHQPVQRPAQRVAIKPPAQPHIERDVIGLARPFQLRQEP